MQKTKRNTILKITVFILALLIAIGNNSILYKAFRLVDRNGYLDISVLKNIGFWSDEGIYIDRWYPNANLHPFYVFSLDFIKYFSLISCIVFAIALVVKCGSYYHYKDFRITIFGITLVTFSLLCSIFISTILIFYARINTDLAGRADFVANATYASLIVVAFLFLEILYVAEFVFEHRKKNKLEQKNT